jgi:hypothetical protein
MLPVPVGATAGNCTRIGGSDAGRNDLPTDLPADAV